MDLSRKDLVIDRVYRGSRNGNASDDPLPSLLGVDNGAGFRHLGKRPSIETLKLLVLKTNLNDPDWPDHLNAETGLFVYYGDNKSVREIHDTPRQGNLILRNFFDARHRTVCFGHFPPILLFGGTGEYRDVRFLGLAVPGAQNLGPDDDLAAIWRSMGTENLRFQNYRATFTVLDVPVVKREWIDDIQKGDTSTSKHAPGVWLDWVKNRKFTPLYSPHTIEIRSKEQLPRDKDGLKLLSLVYEKVTVHFTEPIAAKSTRYNSAGTDRSARDYRQTSLSRVSGSTLKYERQDVGRCVGVHRRDNHKG